MKADESYVANDYVPSITSQRNFLALHFSYFMLFECDIKCYSRVHKFVDSNILRHTFLNVKDLLYL